MKLKKKLIEKIKDTVAFVGICWGLGMTLLLYWTFLLAYFTPAKAVIVYIDKFNEALFEFYLMPIVTVVVSYGVWRYYKKIVEAKVLNSR
jgi:hypothetical protein